MIVKDPTIDDDRQIKKKNKKILDLEILSMKLSRSSFIEC